MMKLTLERTYDKAKPTYGELWCGGDMICQTFELPWWNNQHNISCIPEGTYEVIPHNTEDKPNTFELVDVPNREGILIHTGNTVRDTLGCILVGAHEGELNGEPAILDSQSAMKLLRERLNGQSVTIEIKEAD